MADAKTSKKKKIKKNVPTGIAHVHSTFNNTIVTITDPKGNVVSWSSAGSHGFKGSRKATPFAAQVTGEAAARKAKDCGMRNISILVKGPGAGRESALRAIGSVGINVSMIKDITPLPHNGCKARKDRRV
ncbi:UNVERIFIED_CONTAM: hypothetical protein GTU68_059284 [Idotea baltica]|nr:hypothetical protein [Idotea baltica]